MEKPDTNSHGYPIEVRTADYVVHAVHISGFKFEHLNYDIIRRNLSGRDSLIPVDGHERGCGKSRWTQHYIRTELWPVMYEYGLVVQPEWDWAKNTVFYDSDEYQAKFITPHQGWAILTDDEAWSKMFARNSMRGTQKETMECFGVGRFLKTNAFIMTPGFLEVDKIVRNTVATHWLHIAASSETSATIYILKKCRHQHWPMDKVFWDCLAHIPYPYTFPKEWDEAFEAEKIAAWDRYQDSHQDYKVRRIERLRRREELLAKKQEKLEADFASKRKKEVVRKKEKSTTDDNDIGALEDSHTASPFLPEEQ